MDREKMAYEVKASLWTITGLEVFSQVRQLGADRRGNREYLRCLCADLRRIAEFLEQCDEPR